MKLGLHIADFTWPGGAPRLGPQLAEIAAAADEAGFDRISVMDHPGERGERVEELVAALTRYAALGITVGHGMVAGVSDLRKIETLRTEVMPAIEAL